MSSRTWTLSKDTNTITNYGNGSEQHAPIGKWGSYVHRYFAQYGVDVSGMASISAASIHIKSSTATHVGFGASPTVKCSRVTSSWVGSGGSEGTWSPSADPNRGSNAEPTATSTGETTNTVTASHSTWDTIDVTAIAQAWLAGSANYGIRLMSTDESNTAKTWEGYAQASSYDSYITVTYTATSTANPPTATPVEPLTGALADMSYTAGSGWASPRPTVDWSFSDPDSGNTQSAYRVIVYNDSAGSAGSTLYDSGKISSAVSILTIPATFTEGSYYHWQVDVWDSTGVEASAFSANQRFRTRWSAGEYYANLGAAPSAWSINTLNTTGTVTVEYNSTTNSADPGAGLGTWQADLGLVTLQQYLRYRVWLLPNNAVAPSLDKIVFNYQTSAVPAPDNWTLSAHAGNDTSVQVYGTKSMKLSPISVDERCYQLVNIEPNTRYMVSGWIKQSAIGVYPYIAVGTTTTSAGDIATAPGSTSATDFTQVYVSFDSGALSQVYVSLGASGAGSCWFDAIQLVASQELTPWMPALISNAVTIDASGLRVDGSLGGSVRLRGSTGGTRDIVELGARGLRFGADVNLYSPLAKQINFGDASLNMGGTTFPTSPATYDCYFRTDYGLQFYYDATRWVSTTLFTAELHPVDVLSGTINAHNLYATLPANLLAAYLVNAYASYIVVTTNNATNFWTMQLQSKSNPNTTTNRGSSFTTAARTADNYYQNTIALGIALATTDLNLALAASKTLTPGALYIASAMVTYRLIAT